jgi:hypothetical protein
MAIRQVEAALIYVCMWKEGWTNNNDKSEGHFSGQKKTKINIIQ